MRQHHRPLPFQGGRHTAHSTHLHAGAKRAVARPAPALPVRVWAAYNAWQVHRQRRGCSFGGGVSRHRRGGGWCYMVPGRRRRAEAGFMRRWPASRGREGEGAVRVGKVGGAEMAWRLAVAGSSQCVHLRSSGSVCRPLPVLTSWLLPRPCPSQLGIRQVRGSGTQYGCGTGISYRRHHRPSPQYGRRPRGVCSLCIACSHHAVRHSCPCHTTTTAHHGTYSDPPRTPTWNLRLRRPTPYPLGQRALGGWPGG